MSKYILVVDDDRLLRRSLSLLLQQAGYQTGTAASAEEALESVSRARPDLILLDVGLPGMDGLQALARLQGDDEIPVIFVSARRRELDTILGLELGADGYITKPFNPDLLLAHVKSVLRRSERQQKSDARPAPLVVGDLTIDPAAHTVLLAGRPVELTAREFALLHALAERAGQVVSIDTLLTLVWGPEFAGEPQAVYVHIRWLREKLEEQPDNPRRLINVRGAGYKLAPVE